MTPKTFIYGLGGGGRGLEPATAVPAHSFTSDGHNLLVLNPKHIAKLPKQNPKLDFIVIALVVFLSSAGLVGRKRH